MKAVSNMEELLVQATPGQGGRPAGKIHKCWNNQW